MLGVKHGFRFDVLGKSAHYVARERDLARGAKLTYTSITAALEGAKARGRLIPFVSRSPWSGADRSFLLHADLHHEMLRMRSATEVSLIERWSRLEADIAHFVEGGLITNNEMKCLDPNRGVWELKSCKPKPGLRLFGSFAKVDVFFGTHVVERKTLGAKRDIRWNLTMLHCEELWGLEMGAFTPLSGKDFQGKISNNARMKLEIPK